MGLFRLFLRKTDLIDRTIGKTREKGVLEKSAIFKRLEARYSLPGSHYPLAVHEEPGSYDVHRPYFLFAFKSTISLKAIYETILEHQSKNALVAENILDAVFVLDKGWIINHAPLPKSVGNEWEWEWPWKWQTSDTVLADMMSWLSIVMPRNMREGPFINWYTKAFLGSWDQ